jgi:hypothetical protein
MKTTYLLENIERKAGLIRMKHPAGHICVTTPDCGYIERKAGVILRILSGNSEPVGARQIASRLHDHIESLSERSVHCHLQFMDERGLTESVGRRDGHLTTKLGME